ncbi:L-hydantoinase [Geodia barretti]|uniref:L-hydantoinase n=1 Tax=Geodia barretti TaxID=519541 RepID=A0AA35R405_GEOBA|nr:L-hydantoinase [Geodia barretti]
MLHCESDSILKKSKRENRRRQQNGLHVHQRLAKPRERIRGDTGRRGPGRTHGLHRAGGHVSQPCCSEPFGRRAGGARGFSPKAAPSISISTTSHLEKLGPFVKFTPVIRSAETRDGMRRSPGAAWWTPSAPTTAPSPASGRWTASRTSTSAFGIPGVETTVRLMLNAVSEGVMTLNQMVRICCEQPARVFRIYPGKGASRCDADFIVVDMDKERRCATRTSSPNASGRPLTAGG